MLLVSLPVSPWISIFSKFCCRIAELIGLVVTEGFWLQNWLGRIWLDMAGVLLCVFQYVYFLSLRAVKVPDHFVQVFIWSCANFSANFRTFWAFWFFNAYRSEDIWNWRHMEHVKRQLHTFLRRKVCSCLLTCSICLQLHFRNMRHQIRSCILHTTQIYHLRKILCYQKFFLKWGNRDETRWDIKAKDSVFTASHTTIFAVKIFNPSAITYKKLNDPYKHHESLQQLKYQSRILIFEQSSFVPLVFSCIGGAALQTKTRKVWLLFLSETFEGCFRGTTLMPAEKSGSSTTIHVQNMFFY